MRTFALSRLPAIFAIVLLLGGVPGVAAAYLERYTVTFETETYIFQCRDPSWLSYIGEASNAEDPFPGMSARIIEAQMTPFLAGLNVPMCDFLTDGDGRPYQVAYLSDLRLHNEERIDLVDGTSVIIGLYIHYDEQGLPMYSAFGFPVSPSGKKMPAHDAVLFFLTPYDIESLVDE